MGPQETNALRAYFHNHEPTPALQHPSSAVLSPLWVAGMAFSQTSLASFGGLVWLTLFALQIFPTRLEPPRRVSPGP